MHEHWNKYLNIKALIVQHDPSWILELGAGTGLNTRNLLDTGRKVVVITDGKLPAGWESEVDLGNLRWIDGISYCEIQGLRKIPFVVLDTDHNGWTLDKELNLLHTRLIDSGVICLHDTETFKERNGYAMNYSCGVPYLQEILDDKRTYGDVLDDHLRLGTYRELSRSTESNGAVALQKAD